MHITKKDSPNRKDPAAAAKHTADVGEQTPAAVAEKLLMERYAPPCIIVNDKYEVSYISTRTQRYMEVPVGEPTQDILRMAREELRPALRAAIYKAFTEQKQVAFRGVKIAADADSLAVDILVEPLAVNVVYGKLAMVILEPVHVSPLPVGTSSVTPQPSDNLSKDMLIRQLEEQLRITHDQLQATTEQLETSGDGFLSANEELMSMNEEFQATNEELQSTNEELETSKEELQALNEELVTVNSELQGKVEELDQSNSDLENLFISSALATIFLDLDLVIKRFSPTMATLFNLIPADIGRPFRHLNGTLDWTDFSHDAAEVLEKQMPVEREVTALQDRRTFIIRILPYQTKDNRIDGIVVTLIDITHRKRREENISYLASYPQLNPNPIVEVDFTGRVTFTNPATTTVLKNLGFSGTEAELLLPPDMHDILGGWDRKTDTTLYREIELNKRTFGETVFLTVQFGVARIYALDVTERKQMEDALRESEQGIRRKLDSIIAPEGDVSNLDLGDIIDTSVLQALVDDFYALTHMPMGLIDLKGKVLVGAGWQDICTKYHRVHPETCSNCIESDVHLSAGIPQGAYKIYKCKNNMWDVATPIMIGERHFGNLFIGQFFFEDELPDYEFFRTKARQYGFDEQEYLAALDAVPRLSKDNLNRGMSFFMQLANVLTKLSHNNLKLARLVAERDYLVESLRQSEEQFRIMFEQASVGKAQADLATGRFLRVNAALCQMLGFSEHELLQRTFFDVTHSEDRGGDRAKLDELAGGTIAGFESEKRYLRPDGTVIWGHVVVNLINDATGGPLRTMAVIQDVTEHKLAVEALRQSEDKYRDLVNNAISVIIRWRIDGVLTFFNEYAQKFFGYGEDEIIGRDVRILIPEQDAQGKDLSGLIQNIVEHPEQFVNNINENILRDGSKVWMAWTNKPIFDEQGHLTEILAVGSDITERKQAEEEIRRHAEELNTRNEELMRLNRIMEGRELRMIELKREINELSRHAGKALKYPLAFDKQ